MKIDVLLKRQRGRCFFCGTKIYAGKQQLKPRGTIEHLRPRSRGGTDALENLAAACRICNQEKGNRTLEEYVMYLRKRPDYIESAFEENKEKKTNHE